MSLKIESFTGQYAFLSNFFPCKVELEGRTYPTVEHAFQAMKSLDEADREKIQKAAKPGSAKALGKRVKLREGWNDLRLVIMLEAVRSKFSDPDLKKLLLETGDAELVEGNTWNDSFWGVCRGKGQNHLGKILMKTRDELRKE